VTNAWLAPLPPYYTVTAKDALLGRTFKEHGESNIYVYTP
jgi:hypothetical protein